MSAPKNSMNELKTYPGDMVIRAKSKDIERFNNLNKDSSQIEESSSELANSVTLTIIAETLEETSIVIQKVNKNVSLISNQIFEKLLKEYLVVINKTQEWFENMPENEMDVFEKDFEEYVSNLDGLVTFRVKMDGVRKSDKKNFTSQIILRSNGGLDEVLKALPLITNKDSFNRKVKRILQER